MSDFVPNFDLNFDLSDLDDDDVIVEEVKKHNNGPETSGGRFRNLSEDEVAQIAKSRMEKSTVYNTSWGVRILKKWCSTKGLTQEFEKLPVSELSGLLRQFYAEVRKEDGTMYSKQSYVGLRAAIHRHITGEPYKRQINIMQDREFQSTNHVFLGVLKALKRQGLDFSKPKPVIGEGDLKKLFSSNTLGMHTPKALLNLVWFYIEFHFCRRGREGLTHLKKSSFRFQKDDVGRTFCALKFNESTKNHPGDCRHDFQSEKRMYGNNGPYCPIVAIQKYINKLHPDCNAFFQRAKLNVSEDDSVWFDKVPLGKNKLSTMMKDISKAANLSTIYTNHCVRATTITVLSHSGFDPKTVSTLSGHRCESSLRSYCRDSSVSQKREMSDCLQMAVSGQVPGPSSSSNVRPNVTESTFENNVTLCNVVEQHSKPNVCTSVSNVTVNNSTKTTDPQARMFSKCNFSGTVNVYISNSSK